MPNFCLGLVARNPSWQRSCATASTDRTYDRNRFDAPSPSSCKPGAVHIWVPAFAGTTALRIIWPLARAGFLERGAERVGRVDAQNLHLLGEERQLLERQHEVAVLGVALDVGVELG